MGAIFTLFWMVWAGACAVGLYYILPKYKKEEIKEFFHIEKLK